MLSLRPAAERGTADLGWLHSEHSFSFASYFDPRHVGFGPLRVINEDTVAASAGFDTHAHRDMEILSWVLDGALEHRDDMGNGSVIRPGDLQRMSAGTGVRHSEFNASDGEPVHFLQIWVVPERVGVTPGYEQKHFPREERTNRLCLIASRSGRDGSVMLHQDVDLYAATLTAGNRVTHAIPPGRLAWLQVTAGAITVDGEMLQTGDGAGLRDVRELVIGAEEDADFLLFDMTAA